MTGISIEEKHRLQTMGMVSSNSWDVCGASSVGLTTFWIQRTSGEPPEKLGFAPDRAVRAITDLARLVEDQLPRGTS